MNQKMILMKKNKKINELEKFKKEFNYKIMKL